MGSQERELLEKHLILLRKKMRPLLELQDLFAWRRLLLLLSQVVAIFGFWLAVLDNTNMPSRLLNKVKMLLFLDS
jgi:hypothetical protein